MSRLLIAIGLCALVVTRAGAENEAGALFGILGQWAADFKQSATAANPQIVYRTDGVARPIYAIWSDRSAPVVTIELRGIRILEGDRLEFGAVEPAPCDRVTLRRLGNGRLRSMQSIRGDGTPTICDDVSLDTREETPSLEKCLNEAR